MIEILTALEVDDDGNEVYKESFKIDKDELEAIIEVDLPDYETLDEFLEVYEPETDGVEVYEIAKEKGLNVEKEVVNAFEDEEEEDFDTSEYDSLDDMDFEDDDEEE